MKRYLLEVTTTFNPQCGLTISKTLQQRITQNAIMLFISMLFFLLESLLRRYDYRETRGEKVPRYYAVRGVQSVAYPRAQRQYLLGYYG